MKLCQHCAIIISQTKQKFSLIDRDLLEAWFQGNFVQRKVIKQINYEYDYVKSTRYLSFNRIAIDVISRLFVCIV